MYIWEYLFFLAKAATRSQYIDKYQKLKSLSFVHET